MHRVGQSKRHGAPPGDDGQCSAATASATSTTAATTDKTPEASHTETKAAPPWARIHNQARYQASVKAGSEVRVKTRWQVRV